MLALKGQIGLPLDEDRGAVPAASSEGPHGSDLETRLAVFVEKDRLGKGATLDDAVRSLAAQKAKFAMSVLDK